MPTRSLAAGSPQPRPTPTSTDHPATLSISLLGGFRVAVGERVVAEAAWKRRKARHLVKLLALTPGHRLLREQVLDLLWPDLDPEAAAGSLRQVLHAARQALDAAAPPDRYLRLEGDLLTLQAPNGVHVDVEAFTAAAAAARRGQEPAAYGAAAELYAGDLLPEDAYEDWAADRRQALREQYLALLLALARLAEARGEPVEAITALQRLLTAEPTHEEAHRGLMRLYALTEQRRQALRQYAHLQEVLHRELEVEPEPASQDFYREILAGRFPPAGARLLQPVPLPSPSPRLTGNLPHPLTSFIGRERELVEVRRLLGVTRLLTLTGTGGCGKTRLALQVAAEIRGEYPDGVWLVELAALSDPDLVPQAVVAALGLREQPRSPLAATIVDALRSKALLLVLDNCEHLIEACAQLVETLLRACPEVHVLATSREAVRVAGEVTWRVPSLALPDAGRLPPLEQLERYEAVRLFIERARLSQPGFVLRRRHAPAVAEICRRLDGIPLAIELAAARLRGLTAEQIAARLDDRFQLLGGGSRTAPSRQQTLRATVEWSYELLRPAERRLFNRLAVFAGGWSVEAAEAVCSGQGAAGGQDLSGEERELAPEAVLDLLMQLADKSLVVAEEGPEGVERYRLLETLRQYGREQLVASGEAERVQRRHADYFVRRAEEEDIRRTLWARDVSPYRWFEREHDNLRAALQWLWERQVMQQGLRLGIALHTFWSMHGSATEGRQRLTALLALPAAARRTAIRAQALRALASLTRRQTDYATAITLFEESLAIYRELGDAAESVHGLIALSNVHLLQGNFDAARGLVTEAQARAGAELEPVNAQRIQSTLGQIALHEGQPATARAYLLPILEEERRRGGRAVVVAYTCHSLGNVALAEGKLAEARDYFVEGIENAREFGELVLAAHHLEGLAGVAAAAGQYEQAARLAGAADAARTALGVPNGPAWRSLHERQLAPARHGLSAEAFQTAWVEGQALPLERAVAEVLADEPRPDRPPCPGQRGEHDHTVPSAHAEAGGTGVRLDGPIVH